MAETSVHSLNITAAALAKGSADMRQDEQGVSLRTSLAFTKDHFTDIYFVVEPLLEFEASVGHATQNLKIGGGPNSHNLFADISRFSLRGGVYAGLDGHGTAFVFDGGLFLLGGAERYHRGPMDDEEDKHFIHGDQEGWNPTFYGGISSSLGIRGLDVVRLHYSAGAVTVYNPVAESKSLAGQAQIGLKFVFE